MATSEASEPQPALDPSWQAPETLDDLPALVRNEMTVNFRELETEVVRLEALTPAQSGVTYHEIYLENGLYMTRRSALFKPGDQQPRSKRTFNVVVNDEFTDNDSQKRLQIGHFLVNPSASRVAVRQRDLVRSSSNGSLEPAGVGPLLQKRTDQLEVVYYKEDLVLAGPPKRGNALLYEIDQNGMASRLLEVLKMLGSSSLETDFEIVYK